MRAEEGQPSDCHIGNSMERSGRSIQVAAGSVMNSLWIATHSVTVLQETGEEDELSRRCINEAKLDTMT